MSLTEFAAAKVNLTLHVTGRRADGYHLLDSLVCFAGVGDALALVPKKELSLTIEGTEAAGLQGGEGNLVIRAARSFGLTRGAQMTLNKALPRAAGIGGGSADAAAALRGLSRLWGTKLPDAETVLALGADVPVCLAGRTCRMQGVGGQLSAVPALPPVWAVLANPRVEVPTPAVFGALASRENAPMPEELPRCRDALDLATWLATQRNDMEPAALSIEPLIGRVLSTIAAQPEALLARMSGSGATCFALFPSARAARQAATALRQAEPGWWVRAAPLGDADKVAPKR